MWSQGEGGGSPSEAYAIRAIQEAGFKVTHLSPLTPDLPKIEESEGVEFVRIANPFRKYQAILKTGIAFAYRLPSIFEWSGLVSSWLHKAHHSFDLVVGHSSETVFALRLASRYLKVPSISRLYGISASIDCLRRGLRRELYFDLISLLRHPPDHIVLTNDGTCGDAAMLMFGIQPGSHDFLFNGYEPSLLKMKTLEASPGYVLTASRLVDWKRVDRVIRIACLCRNVRFIILGDGPERWTLERLIKKMNLEETVEMKGEVSRETMYEYLRGASAVLAAQDLSNLNNTVLEAMVLAKPVVTFDTGCTAQLISHEKTGLLYPVDDLAGAASGIERLMKDKSLRVYLGKQAKTLTQGLLDPWPERIAREASIYRRFGSM